MKSYTAVTGQSMYDICLITYGSMDYLVKLANDNTVQDLNNTALTGISFTYDNALVVNEILHQQINQQYGTSQSIIYGTGISNQGSRYHDGYYDNLHD